MIALYFFGPMVESHLGSRRYLAFYLLCGIMGAAAYVLLWLPGVLVSAPWIPLVGASAGIFGVLIAGATIAPDTAVMLLFPPIPMSLRTLAWILIGIGVLTIVLGGPNAGGQAAHLGGAALGYLLIRRPNLLNFAAHIRTS
jgi:membrane associated rhomboid family serine protease